MNAVTAAELKRRDMAAIEDGLRHGMAQCLKHDKPSGVVLSEDECAQLAQGKVGAKPVGISAVQWLLNQPAIGTKRKTRIDKELHQERDSWK